MNFLIDDVIFQYTKSNLLLAMWELFLSELRLTGSTVNISILSRTGKLDKNADDVIYTRPYATGYVHTDIVQISALAKTVEDAFFISSYSTHCYSVPSAVVISSHTPSLNFLRAETSNASELLAGWAGYQALIATDKQSAARIKKIKPSLDPLVFEMANFEDSKKNQQVPGFANPPSVEIMQKAIAEALKNWNMKENREAALQLERRSLILSRVEG